MASIRHFRDVPPFPDDVPLVEIPTLLLVDLRIGQQAAVETLMNSCKELGFFMLDLQGDNIGKHMIDGIDQLFNVGKELMALPEEEKCRYLHNMPESFLGYVNSLADSLSWLLIQSASYKPRGQARTENNEPDRFEWFNIGQDGLVGNAPLQPVPPLVQSHLPLLQSFLKQGQDIVALINTILATRLGLPPEAFTRLQLPTKLSGTVVRFIKAFASPEPDDLRTSMIHHTDFGTVTLLANVIGGLQILPLGKDPRVSDSWAWVRPKVGCLIVNIGDAMIQWTGGLLRSNVHRINFAPGEQRLCDRYSLAILFRPERDASMRRLTGHGGDDSDLSAWEWEVQKAMALRRETAAQSKDGN
jgi:isopenicillin N synthase-like dioxygenase